MSWYRPKPNTSNPNNVQDEVVSYVPMSPPPGPPPSIGSPRSQPPTVVPMRFGPAMSVSGPPEVEKTRNTSFKRAPKPHSALPATPRLEEPTSPREGPLVIRELMLDEFSTSIRKGTNAPSPDPTFSTLPAEEYPSNPTGETVTETPEYIPSPQTEANTLPGREGEGPKSTPGPLFSTSTPSSQHNPSRPGDPQQRSPSPPLRSYSTPEGISSTGDSKAFNIGPTATDADSVMTAPSIDSTPRIHSMTTLHDNMSHISFAGSVDEVLAGMLYTSYLSILRVTMERCRYGTRQPTLREHNPVIRLRVCPPTSQSLGYLKSSPQHWVRHWLFSCVWL
jgi:hypothetical protein